MTTPENRRTVMIRGPFTDDEVLDIMAAVLPLTQAAEQARPGETFQVMVDAPDADIAFDELLAMIPTQPGYERITREITP
jgi:hypothetical protein